MKSILARTAAASALALMLAGGASAQQDPSGHVSIGASNTNIDNGPDYDAYYISGSYFNALTENWNLQLDGAYDSLDTNPDSTDIWSGQANLFVRDGMRALGVFGAIADNDVDTIYGVGGEGALFQEHTTWGGSVGWFDGGDSFDSLYGACGYGKLYGTDNFAIEGRAALANVDFGGADSSAYSIGAGAEYELAGSPISFGAGVDFTSFDDLDLDATTIGVNGTLHFGTTSLKQRDRGGAGMHSASCLINISRY